MQKLLFVLIGISMTVLALAGGSSGVSCTGAIVDRSGMFDGKIRSRMFDGKSIGCNCTKNADKKEATGYRELHKDYPKMGECQSSGEWVYSEEPCFQTQPSTAPVGMTAKAAEVGVCWDLWCDNSGEYVMGTMGPNGERVNGSVRFDQGCKACPAAEELVIDYSDPTKIELKVQVK